MGQEQERAGGQSGVPVKERWAGGQQLARCQEPSPAPPPPPAQAVWSPSPPAADALSSPSQPPPPLVPPAPTASRVARTGTAPGGRASCEVPMTRDPMMTGRCRRHGSGGAAISSHGAKRRKAKRMGGRPSIWPATTRGRHTSVPDIPLRCQWHTAPPLVHPVGKLPLSQQWQWSRRVARHGDALSSRWRRQWFHCTHPVAASPRGPPPPLPRPTCLTNAAPCGSRCACSGLAHSGKSGLGGLATVWLSPVFNCGLSPRSLHPLPLPPPLHCSRCLPLAV